MCWSFLFSWAHNIEFLAVRRTAVTSQIAVFENGVPFAPLRSIVWECIRCTNQRIHSRRPETACIFITHNRRVAVGEWILFVQYADNCIVRIGRYSLPVVAIREHNLCCNCRRSHGFLIRINNLLVHNIQSIRDLFTARQYSETLPPACGINSR